jgi:nucleotide-binding universal stress UspA family protein
MQHELRPDEVSVMVEAKSIAGSLVALSGGDAPDDRRDDRRDDQGPLVVGVDGSDESVRALMTARRLARLTGSRVIVVYVKHHPPTLSPDVPAEWTVTALESEEKDVRELIARWLVGVPTEIVVTEGGIAHELERVAAESGAAALILGRSHGGLLHHLIEGSGSVTGHAVKASPVPVIVVR